MSCVRIASATITRVANVQKSLGSKSSRLRKWTMEGKVMGENPKAVGPGSVVVGPPRLEYNKFNAVLVRVSHDVQ